MLVRPIVEIVKVGLTIGGTFLAAHCATKIAKSTKNQSPNNGQKCLDNSLSSKGNSEQRVAIEGDNFVIL
ncbi:MAG TPA: hypothetical protein VLB80_01925, partial [Candidatus Babeliales bacterium]|nr:hypothetical protein [Candidatus Babeliales bacterium]